MGFFSRMFSPNAAQAARLVAYTAGRLVGAAVGAMGRVEDDYYTRPVRDKRDYELDGDEFGSDEYGSDELDGDEFGDDEYGSGDEEEEEEEYDFPDNVIFVRSETPPSTATRSFRGVFFFASDAAEYASEIGTTVLIVEYDKTFFVYVLGSDDDEPYPI